MDPSRWSCGQDGLLAPAAWKEHPRDGADQGPLAAEAFTLWVGERQAGRRWASVLRWAGQGIHAYLSEPVSAFSVAICPGIHFRRAHPCVFIPLCSFLQEREKRQVAAALVAWKAGPPPLGNSQPALQQVDRRRRQRGRGSWRWTLTHSSSHRRPRAPFPVNGCQGGIYTWSCQRAGRIRACPSASPLWHRDQGEESDSTVEEDGGSPRSVRQTQLF